MEILYDAKRILSYAGVTKAKSVSIGGKQISVKFIQWFLAMANVFNIIMELVICVKFYEKGIQAMLVPIHLVMAFSMAFFIYMCLLWRHDDIIMLYDRLERVIVASIN